MVRLTKGCWECSAQKLGKISKLIIFFLDGLKPPSWLKAYLCPIGGMFGL